MSATHSTTTHPEEKKKGITAEEIAIVKSTVPILETGGETLTKHFYSILMKDNNVRPLFNQTHQVSGTQPRALANSVLCYAKNIDALENLGPLAAQIVNKHVSFCVLPEHYPIVGTCLLRAIREVLGAEVATDAVINAWASAYFQLADILIAAEAEVYDSIAAAPGGWRGARKFIVSAKTPVNKDGSIVSFDLVPEDKGPVLAYRPGQYIGIMLQPPKGMNHDDSARRNYSLSKATDGKSLRITVKKLGGGLVSTLLHDTVKVGDALDVFPPAGEFTIDVGTVVPSQCPASTMLNMKKEQRGVLFLTAGVGITPTIAMLEAATASNAPKRPITFMHYTHDANTHAFADHVATIAKKNTNVNVVTVHTSAKSSTSSTTLTGRINKDHLKSVLASIPTPSTDDLDVFVLGPKGFMKTSKDLLVDLGVPANNIKWEFFGPAEAI